jgi:hypothetical protein
MSNDTQATTNQPVPATEREVHAHPSAARERVRLSRIERDNRENRILIGVLSIAFTVLTVLNLMGPL